VRQPANKITQAAKSPNDTRQVFCLVNAEGHVYMKSFFDRLPLVVRQRLATSEFNICPACLKLYARKRTIAGYFAKIEEFERMLRQQQTDRTKV
jgi:hypothetical protein